jgi:hypothetical protein
MIYRWIDTDKKEGWRYISDNSHFDDSDCIEEIIQYYCELTGETKSMINSWIELRLKGKRQWWRDISDNSHYHFIRLWEYRWFMIDE